MFVVRCKKEGCGGLLRPHVVWFGENLDPQVMLDAKEELDHCDLCLVVGNLPLVVQYFNDTMYTSEN